MKTQTRVNIGCGQTPTPGWVNFDNSLSVRLARLGAVADLLARLGLLASEQRSFIAFARTSDIMWADATRRIPLPSESVEVLYSSHMVEHLDGQAFASFLREARRVLADAGIIRIAVPDLRKLVDRYVTDGDADAFIERTLLTRPARRTMLDRARYLFIGERLHQWMYDGTSLCRVLSENGFENCRVLEPGGTTIPDPGPLSLREREEDSVYVEARKA